MAQSAVDTGGVQGDRKQRRALPTQLALGCGVAALRWPETRAKAVLQTKKTLCVCCRQTRKGPLGHIVAISSNCPATPRGSTTNPVPMISGKSGRSLRTRRDAKATIDGRMDSKVCSRGYWP